MRGYDFTHRTSRIYHNNWTSSATRRYGQWSEWIPTGPETGSSGPNFEVQLGTPAVSSWGRARIDLFNIGNDNSCFHKFSNNIYGL